MHASFVPDLLAASDETLTFLERQRASSDPCMEPLRLDSSSTQARSQTGATPPPRFINPAKITKFKEVRRGTASYLNQQQLYMLRQQETRVVRKLETKSIPQLQMLQHKALTSHAGNKIKDLIQKTLFEKHMAEMKEWEGQVDVWSKDGRDEESKNG